MILKVIFIIILIGISTLFHAINLEYWLMVNLEATRIPIFGFHNIIENPSNYGLDYQKQDLATFLEYLCQNNYWFLSANEFNTYFLHQSQKIPEHHWGQKAIMITFDDGYKSVVTHVLPIVEKLVAEYQQELKVVLFVNPQLMQKIDSQKYANCQEFKLGFDRNFFDIQSHGLKHQRLTSLNPEDLVIELSKSQEILKSCVHPDVASHIAYAYNDFNQSLESPVSQYYQSGYLYNHKIFKLGYDQNSYQIPRVRVTQKDSPQDLIQIAQFSSRLQSKPKSYQGGNLFNIFINFL